MYVLWQGKQPQQQQTNGTTLNYKVFAQERKPSTQRKDNLLTGRRYSQGLYLNFLPFHDASQVLDPDISLICVLHLHLVLYCAFFFWKFSIKFLYSTLKFGEHPYDHFFAFLIRKITYFHSISFFIPWGFLLFLQLRCIFLFSLCLIFYICSSELGKIAILLWLVWLSRLGVVLQNER